MSDETLRSATSQTSPPLPPSPPFGPPNATGPSRRNDTQPAPPSPPRTFSWASSTNPLIGTGQGYRRRVTPIRYAWTREYRPHRRLGATPVARPRRCRSRHGRSRCALGVDDGRSRLRPRVQLAHADSWAGTGRRSAGRPHASARRATISCSPCTPRARTAPAIVPPTRRPTRGARASSATATASCTPARSVAWPARPRSSCSPTTISAHA